MNILITGGTGSVGSRLSLALSKDDRIFVFTRKKIQSEKIHYIQADLCDNESLSNIDLKGIDVVYHLAANINEMDTKMYWENVESTKNVIELCKKSNVKQIIFLSSSGVLGETLEGKENHEYNPKTDYEKSKTECEVLIKESGIPYTIIRASIIMAPNKIWMSIIGAAKKGFPIIGSGENKFHLSYIDDIVDILKLTKNNEKAKNQLFNVATKDVPTYKEVYKIICDELKCPMTVKHISVFTIKLILFFKNLFTKDPVINNASVDRLVRNRCLNIEKAKIILGFEPKFTTQTGLREVIKNLKLIRLGYSSEEVAEVSLLKK